MPSLSTATDYFKAMHVASRKRITRYPAAAGSVLLSRFRYGIGPRLHSLFGLMDQPQETWKNYLLDENCRVVLRRVNQACHREIVNNKLAFYEHCLENGLDTIPVLCAVDNNASGVQQSGIIISSLDEWKMQLRHCQQSLFIKLIDGSWGKDAFSAQPSARGWQYCGYEGGLDEFYAFAMKRFQGQRGWMVQPRIHSHPDLDKISAPGVLATIRAVTCIVDGKPELLFATLRIPVGDNITDNFSHGSSGNITAPIDPTTGEIGVCRGSINKTWPEIVDVVFHPDTGNRIPGSRIPSWESIRDLLDRGQRSLPFLRTLGWDIAVTENGPLVVEANATYDVDVIQVSHQHGIGDVLNPWLEKIDGQFRS
ncbi:MAG: sugar-transfer associated ATP-grasp domain-containing protein [Pseudohongiellaceae bacterium]